ncbi:uncharacterized protein J4E78_010119 [Alternaria triticimaculans]|uniref:uncharacterized protein n=1 Tax=Alternaria triticimaculans TaxID=297637 RepID=UPI0020C2F067|nr:uncharacterized protein J4E78_010119 [Alternaria triticimaculans]KAI4642646.1 hypothetical protein J4E78_010119 [Alternaria triticimaculans]
MASGQATTTLIKFARFKNATLELFEAPIESTDYIAFSHVWGDWSWRSINGVPYEVKASQEKAKFIANDLPALVGDGAFWMDTLTVNQRNPVEVLEIVDVIPEIFRLAKKTIAVKECDGLYDCCIQAVAGFQGWEEFTTRLFEHSHYHVDHLCAESYLQRLWTLQECLLSHTIEFVVGTGNRPKKLALREQARDAVDALFPLPSGSETLASALFILAQSFCGSIGENAIDEFLKAYVHGGTVVNPHSAKRGADEDIHSNGFVEANRASHRSATMPRDYIFATMPSFPWYTYPKRDAFSMSFGEIYSDLYQQADRSGHAFTCRFTRSMLDPACIDPTDGWRPSKHLPSPSTLGDFLKLMGQRVSEASNASSPHVHVTSAVKIEELEDESSPDSLIARLEASFEHFRGQWLESHTSGELTKFGNDPDFSWTLNHADATRCGWVPIDTEYATRVYDECDQIRSKIGPGLGFEEGDCETDFSSLDETEQEANMDEAGEYVPLFVQARKILARIWHARVRHSNRGAQDKVWGAFKQGMQGLWSLPLLRSIILLAGMVNCRIPLSAIAWINKLFVPVYIRHSEELLSVGFLAKHARQPKQQRTHPLYLLCVGQHLPLPGEKGFGQDLFLVDPGTKVPVGLVPDVMPDQCTLETFVRTARSLYNGNYTDLGENKMFITPRLLSDEPFVPREAFVANLQ